MKIELSFIPDVVIFFCCPFTSGKHAVHSIWGDKTIYQGAYKYIESLLPEGKQCMFFCDKGLGSYKIYETEIIIP